MIQRMRLTDAGTFRTDLCHVEERTALHHELVPLGWTTSYPTLARGVRRTRLRQSLRSQKPWPSAPSADTMARSCRVVVPPRLSQRGAPRLQRCSQAGGSLSVHPMG